MAKLNTDTSIVDKLKSEGKDSSFSARSELYTAATGKTDYTGSASQNTLLLGYRESPTASSSSTRKEEQQTISDYNNVSREAANGEDYISQAQERMERELQKLIKNAYNNTVADIKDTRASNIAGAEKRHIGEAADLRSGLVRIGGYLGETASGTAAQINLNQEQADEIRLIKSEADKALREAKQAYAEKNFQAMQAALDRRMQLEQYAYQKEQDAIQNSMKWTQIKQGQYEFEQSQALKWSSLKLEQQKFNFTVSQANKNSGSGGGTSNAKTTFRQEVDNMPTSSFIANNETYSDLLSSLSSDPSASPSVLAQEFSVAIYDLINLGATKEGITQQLTKNLSADKTKVMKSLIGDIVN